ncbi:SDR family NAD(P)-dependent oxidoreductase [Pseudooceanicola sp.]|uniref:SDR family NAD(P)-dependent oxidoreductase n=1 Tax=Pseudooceanicola sp. TaxID=1914328 RepID=UPI0035C6E465
MTARSILITGCSSGIGLHAARHLHGQGWRVFATCRKPEDVARLREEGLESLHLDYTDSASLNAAFDDVLTATGGTLDALFNNGAIALPGASEDIPREGLSLIFETNLFGPHELTRRAIAVMRKQGHGRIINCSSVLGFVAAPWRSSYIASKFALEGLTDTLRIEMRDTPIHVVMLEPGPIQSDFRKNSARYFEQFVDWQASARAEQYRTSLLTRLYDAKGRDRFELTPEATTAALVEALNAPRPRARYRITTPTKAMEVARRLLPTRVLDWILAKA